MVMRGQWIMSQQVDDEDLLVLEVRQDNTIHLVFYPLLQSNKKVSSEWTHPWTFLDDAKSLNYFATGLEKCAERLKIIAEKLVKEKLKKKREIIKERRERETLNHEKNNNKRAKKS